MCGGRRSRVEGFLLRVFYWRRRGPHVASQVFKKQGVESETGLEPLPERAGKYMEVF
jgi:hypothetical protein